MICKMTFPLVIACALLAAPAHAQSVNTNQLEELRNELSSVSERVRGKIADTLVSARGLGEADLNDRQQLTVGILESMEIETRAILDQVKLTSPFMDELDRARSQVVVILRKQEREPPSPQRDNRVARLEAALAEVEDQYVKLQGVEAQIIRSLSQHAQLRRELQLEAGVANVENFVRDLVELTSGLEQMVAVLEEVSNSTLNVADSAVVVQE